MLDIDIPSDFGSRRSGRPALGSDHPRNGARSRILPPLSSRSRKQRAWVEPRAVTRQSKGKRARRRGHCARHHRELPDPAVFSLARSDPDAQNWIVYIASLSKIVSPGLRVGLAVLPSRLIAPFTIAEQASSPPGLPRMTVGVALENWGTGSSNLFGRRIYRETQVA
jgi:hypothetical protein